MCCGSTESTPAVGPFGPEDSRAEPDTQKYLVSYFNGSTQEVTGLDEVRRVLLDPSARAEGTDENGYQGGSYARMS